MSFNGYVNFKKISTDDKDLTTITITTGALTDRQYVELKHLREQSVVNLVAQSAAMKYDDEIDVETGDSKFQYFQDEKGIWRQKEVEQTELDLGLKPSYVKKEQEITKDVIDDFILTQPLDYKGGQNIKGMLHMLVEGFDYDDVAEEYKSTPATVMNDLSRAREHFAPFAAAWKRKEDEEDDE